MRVNQPPAFAIIVLGLAVVVPRLAPAQLPPPPPPVPGQGQFPPVSGQDLDRLSRRMAEAVRDLGEDIVANVGQAPNGQFLARDAQELERAAGEWYASLRGVTDPHQVRRSYSGIDAAWHRLQGQLGAPGVTSPGIAEEVARVERVDAQLHQALNLNAYPANFAAPVAPAAPTGLDETRRLAYSLAQRGEAVAAAIQADYGRDPRFGGLINDSAQLARLVDEYHDAMANPATLQQQPDYARDRFAQILQRSNALGVALAGANMTPGVRAAWDAYTAVHNLIHANLGLVEQTPQATVPGPAGVPFVANPTAQVAQWAGELDREVDELFLSFDQSAKVAPDTAEMFQDLVRLRGAVRTFRVSAVQGVGPGRLAYEFREVDGDWQRLARRVNRITRGRTGPYVQRIQQIGQTCEQIHRSLGMPGYPPALGPFDQTR